MPLHNVIPLCNFKYVRDIYSGATFLYDTTGQISKDESKKAAELERVIEIDKIEGKLMYADIREIDKPLVKRSLVAQILEINIEHSREFYRQMPEIEKAIEKELEPSQRELNNNQSYELDLELKEINIESTKCVITSDLKMINYTQNIKALQLREKSDLNKVSTIHVELDRTHKGNIDKIHDKILGADALTAINKNESVSLHDESERQMYKPSTNIILDYTHKKDIGKYENSQYIDRINESEIIMDHTTKQIKKITDREITKDSQMYIEDLTIIDINLDHSPKLIHSDVIIHIHKDDNMVDLQRISEREMDKDESKKLFYISMTRDVDVMKPDHLMEAITIIPIAKADNENYLDRIHETDVFKINGGYLDRLHTTDVFKIQEKYADRIYFKDMFKLDAKGINDIQITPVYKEFQKPILNLSIEDIYKEKSRSLNGALIKDIYLPRESKYIEVTKRWWWLSNSSPRDRKIVPNRDYAKMKDILSNPNYEYLRYTNHPIDWGKSWGIDHNIPPAAISIEIMLDLTNIITMIWHKSAHGWLRVTGKEGIQMLMELLYDWYTMNTSSPNNSYYRAYRWVRWEAEKVYFLNTTSGLQAIGILVKNLRDYLKFHHFNRVPIWRNPKAMDEERNFDRLAQNGDLMVDLNKTKGKRHYYIECQDFMKQNPITQSKK